MQCPSPYTGFLQAVLLLVVAALAVVVAWFVTCIEERRETNRRRRLMAESLERYEQSQHFWRERVDVERRKD